MKAKILYILAIIVACLLPSYGKSVLFHGQKVKGVDVSLFDNGRQARAEMIFMTSNGDESHVDFMEYKREIGKERWVDINPDVTEFFMMNAENIIILSKPSRCGKQEIDKQLRNECLVKLSEFRSDVISKKKQIAEDAQKAKDDSAVLYQKLNSLFGYKIGMKLSSCDTNKLIRTDNKKVIEYAFIPDKQFMSFDQYEFAVTPKTKRIFGISASTKQVSRLKFDDIKKVIETKFGQTMRPHETKFVLIGTKGNNKRILWLMNTDGMTEISLIDDLGMKQCQKELDEMNQDRRNSVISSEIDAL